MTVMDFSELVRPGETISYSAPGSFCSQSHSIPCQILVVTRGDEAAVLVVGITSSIIRSESVLPLYQEVVTKTTQLQKSTGFQCEFYAPQTDKEYSITITIQKIEALQELLHVVKTFIAQAEDLHQHWQGRTHQWTETYRPRQQELSVQIPQPNHQAQVSSVSVGSQKSSLFGSSLASNDLQLTNLGDETTNKDKYMQDTLQERKAEYSDVQDITIKCSTWNMAGKDISESLITLLRESDGDPTTVYCTAFQEMDLSAEAYITTTDTRAQSYQAYIEGAIGEYYELIASHQLVGMLLCVYAHKSVVPTISNVLKSYVPCGILGMIGNKGAVGIKFDVMNTTFAVLNCHLAAGQGGSDKRNSDLGDIFKRIFNDSGVWDSGLSGIDNVIVMGDLNYRLNATRPHVDAMLRAKDVDTLLDSDQLNEQRRQGRVLVDWAEGPITFNPTYKFDIGTDLYDSSEKQRIPSFTDRILIRSAHHNMTLVEDSYKSVPEYYQSDHKPVVAKFRAKVEVLLADRQERVRNEVYKKFDKHENDAIPSVKVKAGEDEIDYGRVFYSQPITKLFTVYNPGASTASFSFSRNSAGQICKPWFWPVPNRGALRPQESTVIQVTVCVDSDDATVLNSGHETFNDVLVLHVEGGTDNYVSLAGTWQRTCIGQSLEALSTQAVIRDGSSHIAGSMDTTFVPKAIYRICEYLTTTTSTSSVPLFTGSATRRALDRLQDNLDTGSELDLGDLDRDDRTIALCNLLVSILRTMSVPVLGGPPFARIMAGEEAMAVVDGMEGTALNVLIYLRGFLLALVVHHRRTDDGGGGKVLDRLCRVFGDALVRQASGARPAATRTRSASSFIRPRKERLLGPEEESARKKAFMRALLSVE
ncbi:Inositol-1,4,5-trisphosphate 5-phosphatase 1 [Taphrina deformans PYCC 5710]|uniref:Inositol-1,4,5-trisphosphate 5-phosphatase 1 n=1 Tax=Taphrina deformans (strain PYCC 5710 / ATCC 11124 / CBS 356.35 / IMI 108563 / JCM 9778 / NBRC 8474) TaxID=1097556 RepID=R4X730_TAPDE|nr:Inositol-1,4,5-trisphosphate 5-phosphatase 1 [Taphrina deformans PYCC 5710]|eukprot:CCG81072.1 Inositol-1,4,5-trisphosphate 5-phosphatase 1 [Taphrina deformans PYCC 5710]